jgi:hypothetical protein
MTTTMIEALEARAERIVPAVSSNPFITREDLESLLEYVNGIVSVQERIHTKANMGHTKMALALTHSVDGYLEHLIRELKQLLAYDPN